MSLARDHYRRAVAAQTAAAAEPGHPVDATAYELMLAKLDEDRRALKAIQSIERKIATKRTLLPDYAPWVEGVLAAGRGGQDLVLVTVMVWRLDVGDYAGALDIAAYALAHDLSLPDHYKRDAATLIVEEIADQALKSLSQGEAAPWEALARVDTLTADRDMPDPVRAKLYKAQGLELLRLVNVPGDDPDRPRRAAAALDRLRSAVQLNDRIGVKKEIERLERLLKHPVVSQAAATDVVDGPAPAPPIHDDDEAVPGGAVAETSATAAPVESSS